MGYFWIWSEPFGTTYFYDSKNKLNCIHSIIKNARLIQGAREKNTPHLIANNAFGTETKIATAFAYNNMIGYFNVKITGGVNNRVRNGNVFFRRVRIAGRMIVN